METWGCQLLGKEGASTMSERILQKLSEMEGKLQIVIQGIWKHQGETGVPLTVSCILVPQSEIKLVSHTIYFLLPSPCPI